MSINLTLITIITNQVEMERCEAVKKFSANLTVGQRLKRYLMVRKGKILMKRGLRLLDPLQVIFHYHCMLTSC